MPSSKSFTYEHLKPEDHERLFQILRQALHFEEKSVPIWFKYFGAENFRVLRDEDTIAASLGILPVGQWFGGKCIPMGAIGAVATPPQFRGRGVATSLLREMLLELYRREIPLSALYPSTQTLYRKSGYERAGSRHQYELSPALVTVNDRSLSLREVPVKEPGDVSEIDEFKQLYEKRARCSNGNLDRGSFSWMRAVNPDNFSVFRYFVMNGDKAEGYFVYNQGSFSDPVLLRDVVVLTPAAARRILTFIADLRSMVSTVQWFGSERDPLFHVLKEQKITVKKLTTWMLRIVDVEKALAMRGYPKGLTAEVHFEIADDIIEQNNGRFLLRIEDGRPNVTRGGEGRIRLGIRELAPLYSGYLHPFELEASARLEGDIDALALAGSVFAGPDPWMADMF